MPQPQMHREQALEAVTGQILPTLAERTFSTGSRGFYGSGKAVTKDGARYQVSINVVLIGSKPKAA